MGRPRTPLGAYGNIRTKRVKDTKQWEAETDFRLMTGRFKRVMRTGTSKTDATNKLKIVLTDLKAEADKTRISPDVTVSHLIELWLADVRQIGKAQKTVDLYELYANKWITPELGCLTCREAEQAAFQWDALIKRAKNEKGFSTAKGLRGTSSLICAYGVRFGAMMINPVDNVSQLANDKATPPRALTVDERNLLRSSLDDFASSRQTNKAGRSLGARGYVWTMLPDLFMGMLSTGMRIGEILALRGDDIDIVGQTICVNAHVVPKKGGGVERQEYRKGRKAGLRPQLPSWSVPMWAARKLAAGPDGPVFPSKEGDWQSPGGMTRPMRQAFDSINLTWASSHVLRKTVGTMLSESGLPVSDVATQLGNTKRVAETYYIQPQATSSAAARVLDTMWSTKESE